MGAQARVIKGRLAAWGDYQSQGGVTAYDFLRIQPSALGVDGYIPKAATVPMTQSLLNSNEKTFYIVPLKIPKVLGSIRFNVVYAVREGGQLYDARREVSKAVDVAKIEAVRAMIYGTVLLIIPPIGILLWIAALRLLLASTPNAAMSAGLQAQAS